MPGMRALRRLFWPIVLTGIAVVVVTDVDAVYVFAPLLGLAIWRVGTASFASLRNGAAHVPDGPPVRLDPRSERVVYACGGCGAEVLLLVRGTDLPPRHCGERMTTHREVAGDLLN